MGAMHHTLEHLRNSRGTHANVAGIDGDRTATSVVPDSRIPTPSSGNYLADELKRGSRLFAHDSPRLSPQSGAQARSTLADDRSHKEGQGPSPRAYSSPTR